MIIELKFMNKEEIIEKEFTVYKLEFIFLMETFSDFVKFWNI